MFKSPTPSRPSCDLWAKNFTPIVVPDTETMDTAIPKTPPLPKETKKPAPTDGVDFEIQALFFSVKRRARSIEETDEVNDLQELPSESNRKRNKK